MATPTLPSSMFPAGSGPEIPGLDEAAHALFSQPGSNIPVRKISPYEQDDEIREFIESFEREATSGRIQHEDTWTKNLYYRAGRQWITKEVRGGWRDKRLAKWVPKPVTNKVSEVYDAINSVFATVDLSGFATANGTREIDMVTSEMVNLLEEPMKREHDSRRMWMRANFWHIITGNVILHPWWDPDARHGVILVPHEKCVLCQGVFAPSAIVEAGQKCPNCGSMMFEQAIGQDGKPVATRLSQGKGSTDILSPFEFFVPDSYTSMDEAPGAIRKRWRTSWYYQRVNGKKWLEENGLSFEKNPSDTSIQTLRRLATMADSHNGNAPEAGEGPGMLTDGTVEGEIWFKPCDPYENGLFCRYVGSGGSIKLLTQPSPAARSLPYKTLHGDPLWPFVHIPYERVEGRFWGASPIDLVTQKNDQINQLDSLMQLMALRMSNPVWLEPKGADTKRKTGEPGLVLVYNPIAGSGQNPKPERIEGAQIPSSLINFRAQLLADIEALTGTYDVIKGSKPTGIEAFSALQLLVERSQSRFTPVLMERGDAYARLFALWVELERVYGPLERWESIAGPDGDRALQLFRAADLSGNVTFTVEDGSQVPKTNLGQRAAIEQLTNLKVINPMMPETGYAILQTFGQQKLMPGLDVHVRRARAEQTEWEAWAVQVQFQQPLDQMGQPIQAMPDPMTGAPVPVPPQPTLPMPGTRAVEHDDQIHAAEHRKWANGDKVQKLVREKPELRAALDFFITQHDMAIMQAQMQQQQAEGGGPGTSDLGHSNREGGDTDSVPSGNGQGAQNQGPA
jgi:hypothetical protein